MFYLQLVPSPNCVMARSDFLGEKFLRNSSITAADRGVRGTPSLDWWLLSHPGAGGLEFEYLSDSERDGDEISAPKTASKE